MADMSNQGASGVLNEHMQGDDRKTMFDMAKLYTEFWYNLGLASYFDHSRDLLLMINTFRDQMARPIVGVGHSVGGTAL